MWKIYDEIHEIPKDESHRLIDLYDEHALKFKNKHQFESLLEINMHTACILYYACAHNTIGNWTKALEYFALALQFMELTENLFDQPVKENDYYELLILSRGQSYGYLKKYNEALTDLEEYIEANPGNDQILQWIEHLKARRRKKNLNFLYIIAILSYLMTYQDVNANTKIFFLNIAVAFFFGTMVLQWIPQKYYDMIRNQRAKQK